MKTASYCLLLVIILASCISVVGQHFERDIVIDLEVRTAAFSYGDLDGDNLEEVIVAYETSDFISIIPNLDTKMGTPLHQGISTKTTIKQLVIVDINDDNLNDIVFLDPLNDQIGVLINLGDLTFEEAVFFETGADPVKVIAGDLNNDGLNDLAVANSGSNNLSLFYSDVSTTLLTAILLETGQLPMDVEIHDLDSDGFLDLIVANQTGGSIGFHFGGAEGFSAGILLIDGLNPVNIEIGDIDVDGELDIAAVFNESNKLHLYYGNPDGSYDAPVILDGASSAAKHDFVIADIDTDGIYDVAFTSLNGDLNMFVGNGNKTFNIYSSEMHGEGINQSLGLEYTDIMQSGEKGFLTTNPLSVRVFEHHLDENYAFTSLWEFISWSDVNNVDIGDIDGDGLLDLVLANRQFNFFTIYKGVGDDQFEFYNHFSCGDGTNDVKLIDLNLDDHLDIFMGGFEPSVWINDGTGNFTEKPRPDNRADSFAFADFNNDGYPDLVCTGVMFLNDQTGGFTLSRDFGWNVNDVTTFDYNNDQNTDLVLTFPYDKETIEIYPGIGDGTFGTAITIDRKIYTVDGYDVNGDNLDDLIVTDFLVNDVIAIVLSDETTPFATESTSIEYTGFSYFVEIEDITLDGKPEMVLNWEDLSYFPINEDGSFGEEVVGNIGYYNPLDFMLIDYSGDGLKNDLVTVHSGYIVIQTEKKEADISFINLNRTYNGSPVGDLVVTTPEVNYEITFDGQTIKPSAAGTYTLEVTVVDDEYVGSASDELVISKATLTIGVQDKTREYGDENGEFALLFEGFVGTDDQSDIDELPAINTEGTPTSLPGEFAITLEGGSDNNYELILNNGLLTIEKATLEVTADDVTIYEDEGLPETFTYVITGFKLEEDESVLNVLPVASVDVENVVIGSYPITVSGGEDDAYNFNYTNGTLTISEVLGTDKDIENNLSVYPNPTSDLIHIQSHIGSLKAVEVLDINGKLIVRHYKEYTKDSVFSIDTKTWDPGIYLVKIVRDNKVSYSYRVSVTH